MKIYINRKPVEGPWGGGNKTVNALTKQLISLGHEVYFELNQNNFDIIFCFDPRPNHEGVWYQHLLNYKNQFGAKIIQRVGDLGTHGKPELFSLVSQTLNYSDHFIFPSLWAKNLSGIQTENYSVIRNRPKKIFNEYKKNDVYISDKPKVVTHHWSNSPKKGFDTYKFIDKFLSDKIDFTYIGRVPDGFKFENSNYIPPTDDKNICNILSKNEVYLTASKEEAGANHVLEAMAVGLPVIYHFEGGSINEYVSERGISFENNEQLISTVNLMCKNFEKYKNNCLKFNETISETIEEYCEIICQI